MSTKKRNPSKKEVKTKEFTPKVKETKNEFESIANELVSATKAVNYQSEYDELKQSVLQLSH